MNARRRGRLPSGAQADRFAFGGVGCPWRPEGLWFEGPQMVAGLDEQEMMQLRHGVPFRVDLTLEREGSLDDKPHPWLPAAPLAWHPQML
jgi:hypothetical protein